ncbi:Vmh family MBL fold metallo-hydrolase [Aeromonas simiae]|uniref:MBL fold metallo-hydrolase n=1 Tax=Aeromonas simiae TaxID=218936 RepID=A0A5J6WU57_9GAMM|nr:Vmh family MBL fold metallo-hydrolase [Aeromonas simiae]QFI53757.1 MBL fold metallo-hydrolase [Aeromonas simiae]
MKHTLLTLTLASTLGSAVAAPLNIQVYNPGDKGIFPVSSELVTGEKEAILVDAQFDVKNGQALVDLIKQSGKQLTTIYISAGDPDYYFGLEPILAAFPDVKVLASQHVVDHIKETKDAKLAYWGPILGKDAPKSLTVPQVLTASQLTLEGETIEVKAMNTPSAFLWAPSIKTAFGGVAVSSGVHVWMADSQTQAARGQWVETLEQLLALQPERVIPGHFLGQEMKGAEAVSFTRDYVLRFEAELAKSKDAAALIDAMKQAYPALPVDDGLAIGAKVATGEMKW